MKCTAQTRGSVVQGLQRQQVVEVCVRLLRTVVTCRWYKAVADLEQFGREHAHPSGHSDPA